MFSLIRIDKTVTNMKEISKVFKWQNVYMINNMKILEEKIDIQRFVIIAITINELIIG